MGNYDTERPNFSWWSFAFRRLSRVKWYRTLTPCVLLLGLILTFVNLYHLRQALDIVKGPYDPNVPGVETRKKFAVHGKRVDSGYLFHVLDTFKVLGYTRVEVNDTWDVLWSHDYPFTVLKDRVNNLKLGQKINHFPGSGYVTNKMNLATSNFPFVPRAFQLPGDKQKLLDYAVANPGTMFVQKSNNHRGIKIQPIKSLNLTQSSTFVQTYIDNPMLVDGHKFDIGVYVVLTSIKPLRVYRYTGDTLFRFCPEKYHPFDPAVLDKYVVGDDYLPLWSVDSLKVPYTQGFSMQEAFDSYLRKNGSSLDRVMTQVDTAIRTIYLTKEPSMIDSWKKLGSTRNFFELVRFDFVIDSRFNVYLMEVNMSPNLSSAHFPPNRDLYEQVLYSTFSLVGIASPLRTHTSNAETRIPSAKQIYVNHTICAACAQCHLPCQLCPACMSKEEVRILKDTVFEHWNRMEFTRVFPEASHTAPNYSTPLSAQNQWLSAWFEVKCRQSRNWCQ